jgi:beta-galactosidase
VNGPATIAAVGNGNPATTESFQADHRKAFNGLCMLIVKSEASEPGTISISASSSKLESGVAKVTTESNVRHSFSVQIPLKITKE